MNNGNEYVTIEYMLTIKEFVEINGHSPFTRWFEELNSEAAAKITTALYRLEQGNFSRVEGVGEGVLSIKFILDWATESILARKVMN